MIAPTMMLLLRAYWSGACGEEGEEKVVCDMLSDWEMKTDINQKSKETMSLNTDEEQNQQGFGKQRADSIQEPTKKAKKR